MPSSVKALQHVSIVQAVLLLPVLLAQGLRTGSALAHSIVQADELCKGHADYHSAWHTMHTMHITYGMCHTTGGHIHTSTAWHGMAWHDSCRYDTVCVLPLSTLLSKLYIGRAMPWHWQCLHLDSVLKISDQHDHHAAHAVNGFH